MVDYFDESGLAYFWEKIDARLKAIESKLAEISASLDSQNDTINALIADAKYFLTTRSGE